MFLDEQAKGFGEEYFHLTGVNPAGFVCPITLEEVAAERLCDGHILNEALSIASRKKVIQCVDVDNYFGATIEPDLVNFLRLDESFGFAPLAQAFAYRAFGALLSRPWIVRAADDRE